jgi:predicted nicotinamide N-methyase
VPRDAARGPGESVSVEEPGAAPGVTEITGWTTPGRAPLVPEVVLYLAEDIHRTWERTDEEAPPFWAFAWAGGQALARHVLDHPEAVAGRRVLDLAAGSGIVGLAALRAGAASVVLADTDARARAAAGLNAQVNDVRPGAVTILGDDLLDGGGPELDVDVVLAGDVFYEQPMARRAEGFLDVAAGAGLDVLVGDPGREYLPRRRCTAVSVHDVPGTADLEGRASTPTTVWRFV